MRKRILMVAYHYPPMHGSSGVQRTLRFSQYLAEHGWQPHVLSVHPRAYRATHPGQLRQIPDGVRVTRATAFDTARHLAMFGRYPQRLALPDRWVSWYVAAVPVGLYLIARFRPAVIWSTFPIATAHLIGARLARLSGLPWVADCRDSMTEEDYPRDPATWSALRRLEERTVRDASRVVFTTPGALAMYRDRYPGIPPERWAVIPNGYDENSFADLGSAPRARTARTPIHLVHSGLLYPQERNPEPFFRALASLQDKGVVDAKRLRVTLRASGHDALYREQIATLGIGDLVQLAPSVPYADALAEMTSADGLVIFQAASCNHQIPAKLYEYLRAQRPIFALTDRAGDTAATLASVGVGTIARLDDPVEIAARLAEFLDEVDSGRAAVADLATAQRFSRRAQTGELAELLDRIT